MNLTKRSCVLAGSVALLAAGGGAYVASAGAPDRTQAYLKATQSELAGTGKSVERIMLSQTVAGAELYMLQGADTACVLIAGTEQAPGRSRDLTCTDTATANDPATPMVTRFAGRDGVSRLVALTAPGTAAVSSSTGGTTNAVKQTGRLAVAPAPSDDAVRLLLRTEGGATTEFTLPSLAQEQARAGASLKP